MSEIMDALQALGRLDCELVRLKRIIDAGPEETRLGNEAIAKAVQERTDVENAIRHSATRVAQCNLDIRTAEVEVEDQEGKLKVTKNTKEFKIFTKRINDLKQLIADKEAEAVRLMDETDALRKELELKNQAVTAAEAVLADVKAKLGEEGNVIRQQQAKLAAERKTLVARVEKLNPDALASYRTALSRGKGLALAAMSAGICQECHQRQSPNVENIVLLGQEITRSRCSGCGRILYPSAETAQSQA